MVTRRGFFGSLLAAMAAILGRPRVEYWTMELDDAGSYIPTWTRPTESADLFGYRFSAPYVVQLKSVYTFGKFGETREVVRFSPPYEIKAGEEVYIKWGEDGQAHIIRR